MHRNERGTFEVVTHRRAVFNQTGEDVNRKILFPHLASLLAFFASKMVDVPRASSVSCKCLYFTPIFAVVIKKWAGFVFVT